MTYKTMQIILRPITGLCTPLQADTIWGHLASYIAQTDPVLLEQFLDSYREGIPAVIFSDGMPAMCRVDGDKISIIEQYYPKPTDLSIRIKDLKKQKEIKKARWISGDDMKLVAADNIDEDFELDSAIKVDEHVVMKNAVPRWGDSDTEPYPLEETFLIADLEKNVNLKDNFVGWNVLCKIDSSWIDVLYDPENSPIRNFLKTGYGKKKNVGKGMFEIYFSDYVPEMICDNPNAFITLSSFVPASGDPIYGYWEIFVKYGKLGEAACNMPEYAGAKEPSPFKNPVTMLKPGAVFRMKPEEVPHDWYGACDLNKEQLVRFEKDYVHPALALVMSYRMKNI